jgi:hypothetical protein
MIPEILNVWVDKPFRISRHSHTEQTESQSYHILQPTLLKQRFTELNHHLPEWRSRCRDWATAPTIRGSNLVRSMKFFSSQDVWIWGPPTLLLNRYRGSILALKWLWSLVNHSPAHSAVVKNYSYNSPLPTCFHDVKGKPLPLPYP